MRKEQQQLALTIPESEASYERYREEITFTSFKDFQDCFNRHPPSSSRWSILWNENNLLLIQLQYDPIPKIINSIAVNSECEATVVLNGVKLKRLRQYNFPFKLENINQVDDILKLIECELCETSSKLQPVDLKKYFINVIIDQFNLLLESGCLNTDEEKPIHFILEQVSFLLFSENHYRYSTDLTILSSLFISISPHAYRFVRSSGCIVLPHPKTLSKICARFDLNPLKEQDDANFLNYVSKLVDNLNEKQRIVALLMDEIHLKSYFDYKGGNIVGGSYNCELAAKTAYVFMIRSLLSSFKEVAHIVPVKCINGEDLHALIRKIIKKLHDIGYKVLCVISDNNAINGKSMSLFSSPPEVKFEYPHPCPSDVLPHLYFFFDSVHLLKCIRNNWVNKKDSLMTILYPEFQLLSADEQDFSFHEACFSTIRKLYYLEEHMLVKYSPSLNLKSIYPSNTEKQNVRLALNIFNEKVREGLLYYGNNQNLTKYDDTANFLKIIYDWWSVVNTKTVFKGVRHRNNLEHPVVPNNEPYQYLVDFLSWLIRWKNCNWNGLTSETYNALVQTTNALIKLTDFCVNNLKFDYVLLGKLQSDSLEERFGKYRQLAGGQYLVSIRQIFEIEHKLRIQNYLPSSKLKLRSMKFGVINIDNIENINISDGEINEDIIDCYGFDIDMDFDSNVENLQVLEPLTFIAGSCLRVALKKLKCEHCNIYWIIEKNSDMRINENSNSLDNYQMIINLDRGGLLLPHPDIVNLVLLTYTVITQLVNKRNEEQFLKCSNQRQVAMSIAMKVIDSEIDINNPSCNSLDHLKKVQKFVVRSATNTFLKNYCKKRNEETAFQNQSKKRKIDTVAAA
ncbi:MAG: hypothetical protein H9Q66_04835 [Spiroplasma ixodetis]|nr:hypothetical protein [Spiroplasma ixodetis]